MKSEYFQRPEDFSANNENARIILSTAQERPKLSDFADVFEKDELIRDEKSLSLVKRSISENTELLLEDEQRQVLERKARGEALEVLIIQEAELNDWLGNNVFISRTTEYDDYFGHVDAVLEFDLGEESPERVALAIDASMLSDFHLTTSKLRRNTESVTGKGRATEVKYFQSQVDDYKGSLTNIIPVVIGLEGNNCKQLFADFAQIIKLKKVTDKNDLQKETLHNLNEKMRTNPAQIAFLLEIKNQLEFYKNLVEKRTAEEGVNSKQLERLIGIIDSVLTEKKEIGLGHLENDGVLRTIIQNTAVS